MSIETQIATIQQHREDDRKKRTELKRQSKNFPLSHEGCDAFWKYWRENGETHKHGYYESTWGAIRAYLETAENTKDQRANKTKPRSPG